MISSQPVVISSRRGDGPTLGHPWDISPAEAVRVQQALCTHVRVRPLRTPLRTVGGLDVHGDRGAVAVLSWPDLGWSAGAIAERPTSFPYVPGLLSWREIPALLEALGRLQHLPDVLLCDGHGLAHPRRFGLACHLGVRLEHPTIGCAKTLLCGHHGELAPERGACVSLVQDDQRIGAVVRTRTNVKPVYISIGHLVNLQDAIDVTVGCAPRYRLPEPLRVAHAMAKSGCYPRT